MRTLENSSISVPVYLNLGGPTPSCRIALPFCQLYERATPATLSQKTAQTLTPINLEHFLLLVCTNRQPVNRRLSTDDNSRLQFFLCIQVKNKYAKQNTVFELQFNFFEKTFRISGFTICSLPHRQRTADCQNLVITVTVYLLRSVFLFTLVNYRVHGHRPSVLPPLSFIPFHAVKFILRSRIYLFLIRLPFRHLLHMARYHTFPKNKKRTNQILCFRGMICTSPTVSSRFILRDYFPDTSGEQDKLRMTARPHLLSTASITGISPFPISSLVF